MSKFNILSSIVAGSLFGIGLGIGGMTNPTNVISFLSIGTKSFSPNLAFVMAGAILVFAPAVYLARKKSTPFFANVFDWPTKLSVDKKLLAGAAIFGIGWGITGYCPGPAITSLSSLSLAPLVGVVGIFAGLFAASRFSKE